MKELSDNKINEANKDHCSCFQDPTYLEKDATQSAEEQQAEMSSIRDFLFIEVSDIIDRMKVLKYKLQRAEGPSKNIILSQILILKQKFDIMKVQFNNLPKVSDEGSKELLSSDVQQIACNKVAVCPPKILAQNEHMNPLIK